VIELKLKCELGNAADASNPPLRKVNRPNFRFNKLHVAQNTAERIDNIARIKIAGGDLVQHRREQNEILTVDQSNFSVCAASQVFIQVHCRAQPGESASRDDHRSLFHRHVVASAAGAPLIEPSTPANAVMKFASMILTKEESVPELAVGWIRQLCCGVP